MKKVLMLTSLFYFFGSSISAQNSVIRDSLITLPDGAVKNMYQRLLGVDMRIEYGWMCEYSTVPMITSQRHALLYLMQNNRYDLIKTLLSAPLIETQLYALDALIYQKIKTGGFIGRELSSKIHALKNSDELVDTCQDGTGSYWVYKKTAKESFLELTYQERVEYFDWLFDYINPKISEPKIEIPNISGDF